MRSYLLVSLLVFAGCAQPADPATVQDRISLLVPEIVDETNAAVDGAEPTFAAIDQGAAAFDVLAPGLLPSFGSEPLKPLGDALGEDGQSGADFARELNETLFTEANHEGDGVFVVPVSMLCSDPADTECIDTATRAQLRIRAELADDDGLDFTLVVGAARSEPVAIALRHRALSVSVELSALADAVRELAPPDEPELAVELAGVVSARLDVLGAAHVAVAVTIDDPIHVSVSDGGDPVRIDSAEAHPLVRLELDGIAATGVAQLGLGSTQLHLPDDGGPGHDIDLPGMTAVATLAAGELAVTGLALGDRTTTVSVAGQRGMSIDLNRDAGRRLDLTIAGNADDATFTVRPALDLRIAIDHTVLGDTAPVYDVTRVALDGASAPALRATTVPDQLAVVAGQLTIETNPVGYGATITAGQCIGEDWRSDVTGDYSVLIPTACQ